MKKDKLIKRLMLFVLCTGIAFYAGIAFAEYAKSKNEAFKPIQIHLKYARGLDGDYRDIPVAEFKSNYLEGFETKDIPLDRDLQEYIYILCKDYNIDYALVLGIIETESSFNPSVISGTNDYGLMQINKINHESLEEALGIKDFNNPYENARAGLFILNNLFDKYKDTNKVLMAYNMGAYGAEKLWLKGVFDTKYTKKVLLNAEKYRSNNYE